MDTAPQNPMQRAGEVVEPATGGRGAWAPTLLSAVLVPLLVLLVLAWRTSDVAETRAVRVWESAGGPVTGADLRVAGRLRLEHRIEAPLRRFSRLAFDLRVLGLEGRRTVLRLSLEHRPGPGAPWRAHDLSSGLRLDGANHLEVSTDDVPGLAQARELALVIASSTPLTLALEQATLVSLPLGERCAEMFARLLRPEPLGQYGNNFVRGPSLAGYAWNRVHWISLGLLLALLLARSRLGARRLPLGAHVAASGLVLFGLLDLRNHVDLWSRATAAVERRAASPDLYAYLEHGGDQPLLAAILRYLAEDLPEGRTWFVSILGETRERRTDMQMRYLAFPAVWAGSLEAADVVIAVGPPGPALRDGAVWQETRRLGPTLRVFERR